ncbi:TniB family NTP-binding protein [Pelagibacterium nitratireducens]|uniref:TniB family NTP-binding protein n=1 Tax=Pelagibacterium nitratireducens TaxID=1046114 RepID=A0ABZ2I7W2_9HYPH
MTALKDGNRGVIALDQWDPPVGRRASTRSDDEAHVATVTSKIAELQELYVNTQRDHILASNFQRLLDLRAAPAPERKHAGLLVIGDSGAGKSRMLRNFFSNHTMLPGYGEQDAECPLISMDVPSPVSNKSLGLEALRCLYPQKRNDPVVPTTDDKDNNADIWATFRDMAEELGVWGLCIDEAHDLTNGGPNTLKVLRSTFKRWMAHSHRPILILSGIPRVQAIVDEYEMRRRFLPVHCPQLDAVKDAANVKRIVAKYVRLSELQLDNSLSGLIERLIHASTRQFGITMDLVLEAIEVALLDRDSKLTLQHFEQAYHLRTRCEPDANPFVVSDWLSIDTLSYMRTEPEAAAKKRRQKREEGPY